MFLGLEFPQNIVAEGNNIFEISKSSYLWPKVAVSSCGRGPQDVSNYISRQNRLYGHYSWYSVCGRGNSMVSLKSALSLFY